MRSAKSKESRVWPGYMFGGRLRTSTAALLIAFFAIWWIYDTYQPAPQPPEQVPASDVVPPGFIPDPAYTWAPRTDVQPHTTTTTTTPTTTTSGATTTPTTTGENPADPDAPESTPPTSPGSPTTSAAPTPTEAPASEASPSPGTPPPATTGASPAPAAPAR